MLLRLDLEFLESTPKTLINSLHATARNFDTPSYWTLTEVRILIQILTVPVDFPKTLSIHADIKSSEDNTIKENLKNCRVQGKYAGMVERKIRCPLL